VAFSKRLLPFVKIAVSVGMLALLLSFVDWREGTTALASVPSAIVGAVIAIFAMQFAISAWKWWAAMRALNVSVPFAVLAKTYCIAYFFGTFLPTSVGGDVYRTYRASKHCSLLTAMSGVIMERVFGLIALILVGFFGMLWLLVSSAQISTATFATAVAVATGGYFVVPLGLLYALSVSSGWKRWLPHRLKPAVSKVAVLNSNRFRLVQLSGICLLYQMIAVLPFAFLFASLGESWHLAESAVGNAAGSLAALLPISLNGVGVTEGSFIGIASLLGVNYTAATVVSLLMRLLILPLVAAFGIMYMFDVKRRPTVSASSAQADVV
jgi:uncharacterized membrane protein YbhN (UPF0104 family)